MALNSFHMMLVSLVLLLTFKDLVISNHSNGEKIKNTDEALHHSHTHEDEFDSDASRNTQHTMNDFNDEQDDGIGKADNFVKKIPSLKIKSQQQTIKFLYCYSCGYRKAFEQYSQAIHARYPEINIVGENYTPEAYKLYLAQGLSFLKIVILACVLLGQNPFAYMNMPTPNAFLWAQENKLYATLMIFFVSNAIESYLITTGAFEIYLNNVKVWSKLESDRVPHEKELFQIIDMNSNFEQKSFGNTGF